MNNDLRNLYSAMSMNSSYHKTPKDVFLNTYQDKINNEWEYASDVFLIQEEIPFASKQYSEIEVRINSVKVPEVNTKASDDYKKIIFKNPDGHYGIGCLYNFMDNYWIATKTNILGSATDSIIVRRCNNFLKWMDKDGVIHSEPCVMEYTVSGNNNAKTTDITGVSGNIKGYVQRNSITQQLYSNQRFLIGTPELWSAIKITGNGINNFLNQRTGDYTSNAMIELTFIESEKNEDTDNLEEGIADYYKFKIYINFVNIENESINNAFIGMTGTLEWTAVQNNSLINDITVQYSVEDDRVLSIDNNGNYEFLNLGDTNIVAIFYRNGAEIQTKYIPVNCTNEETENEIKINNMFDFVLQDQQNSSTCYVYNGNEQIESTMTYTVLSTEIPKRCYDMIISEDTHTITIVNNEMYLYSPLKIRVESEGLSYDFEIILKGRY